MSTIPVLKRILAVLDEVLLIGIERREAHEEARARGRPGTRGRVRLRS
jgi:hypothetical protein